MRSSTPSPSTSLGISRREALGILGLGVASFLVSPVAHAREALSEPEGSGTLLFTASDVEMLAIDWTAGGVKVMVDDTRGKDQIRVYETARPGFIGLMPPVMECTLWHKTLTIDYGSVFLSFLPRGSKDLTVIVPSSLADHLKQLSIDGASGSYEVSDIKATAFDVNIASGKLTASNITVQELDLDMASGTVTIDGRIEDSVDMDFASGTVQLTCREVCPRDIDIDAASGRLNLAIPENDGFEVRVQKLSGSVAIDFETTRKSGSDEIYVYKNGTDGSSIDVDIMSGSIHIERSE